MFWSLCWNIVTPGTEQSSSLGQTDSSPSLMSFSPIQLTHLFNPWSCIPVLRPALASHWSLLLMLSLEESELSLPKKQFITSKGSSMFLKNSVWRNIKWCIIYFLGQFSYYLERTKHQGGKIKGLLKPTLTSWLPFPLSGTCLQLHSASLSLIH